MKVRITMRNRYIVEGLENIEEALIVLEEVIKKESPLVTFEHGLVLATEEIKE